MEPPSHIAQLLNSLASFTTTVAHEAGAHRFHVQHGVKSVVVLWPSELGEVFFDFINEGQVLLAESVEYYEAESPVGQAEDVAKVIGNFLLNEVKVCQSGVLLKRQELQAYRGGKWQSVFQ